MEPAFNKQFTNMISIVFHTLFTIFFVYLAANVLYLFMLAVAGLFRSHSPQIHAEKFAKIAVLITAYKEDEVIVNTVNSATSHDYPADFFHVFVAADHLQQQTIDALLITTATIRVVKFPVGSKARSLNYLLNTIDESRYDIALILDSDNIMMPGFLRSLNEQFQKGWQVMQAHRTAKNLQTPVAILDALSEEINNHLFRKAPANLGLSSSLIGSGMAFPFATLKQVYNKPGILDNPACDREVDFEMLVSGLKVRYLPNVVLLDEKVSTKSIYQNQRRRWLESQLMHIGLFFSDWNRVKTKNGDFWNKLIVTLLPPRMFLLALVALSILLALIQSVSANEFTGIPSWWWIFIFLVYVISLFLSIPRSYLNTRTFKAFLQLPGLFLSFLFAALTLRGGRKEFVHTPKTFTGSTSFTESDK